MKKLKLLFALLISLVSLQICLAQEKPALEMVDKFGAVNCSYIRNILDDFLMKLRDEPNAFGYIVFYSGEDTIKSSFHERALRGHVRFRRFPAERIQFINSKPEQEFQASLWISRNGARPSVEEQGEANIILKPIKYRYLFADDTVEIVKIESRLAYFTASECNIEAVDFNRLAQYLSANPEVKAEVLVYHKKKKRAAQVIKLFLDEATNDYKISPTQLKISYAGIDKEAEGRYVDTIATVKIWLVPPQRNRN